MCRVTGTPRPSGRRKSKEDATASSFQSPLSSSPPDTAAGSSEPKIDEALAARIHELVIEFPAWGYRRIWAWLRHNDGITVNLKKVYRIMKLRGWFLNQRSTTPRPRVKASVSAAPESNLRWAVDATHVPCGTDGWAHLVAVIDCHDRQIIGWEFALRGRAKEAERAVEMACLERFGTLRPSGETPVLRSDNGLIFNAKQFRAACRDYRLSQEFITPYTPEQNGMIERWFRSLKEECVWLHNFTSFEHARTEITRWIQFYNQLRPHQALGYQSPAKFRLQKQSLKVA